MEARMQGEKGRLYTYADYLTWPEGERWELIDGVPYASAAPTYKHQLVSGALFLKIGNYLTGKTCHVVSAPFDVRLNAQEGDNTVVQPDISVVCDDKKIVKGVHVGAPDMIIEVLSPGSAGNDKVKKFNAYRKAGVREFWIVDPVEMSVSVNVLNAEGQYIHSLFGSEDAVPVSIFGDLSIDMKEVFSQIPAQE